MSMAAKLSDLVDKTSEANIQADGQAEELNQGTKDPQETEEEDGSPFLLTDVVPSPEAAIRLP